MKTRLPFFDSSRGFAIVLMTIYHFCFDLNHFGLLGQDFSAPFWLGFRNLIVTLFVGLVGVGLALGPARYADGRFRSRLLVLFGGAAFMSAVTYLLFPGAWVFFGILHFIFAACLLGPLLVKAPRLCLPLGILCALLPRLYASPRFSPPLLAITGLAPENPVTVDFVPLLPWLGVVMLGIFCGHLTKRNQPRFSRWELPVLSFLGRHSLLFYMTHQMALFPLAWLIAKANG